jgi:hypothetical protein
MSVGKKKIPNSKSKALVTELDATGPLGEVEEHWTCFEGRLKPVPDTKLQKVAEELLIWAASDDALKISQFYHQKKIDWETFDRWSKRYEPLAKARATAMRMIGDRREVQAMKFKLNANIVMNTMGIYDPEYKAFKKEMDKSSTEGMTQQVIVIDKAADSPLVPKKKEVKNEQQDV